MISNQGSDMDDEVTALEGTLSTARQVKQGMISVLLTPLKAAGQAGAGEVGVSVKLLTQLFFECL